MLRTGNSGAIYFAIAGDCYGPVGDMGAITSNVPLNTQALAELYEPVDRELDRSIDRMFADLASTDIDPSQLASIRCQAN